MSTQPNPTDATMLGRRSDGSPVRRPLSPHMQVYDMLQMSSAISIMHRTTGIIWAGGSVFMVWWLIAAASGPSAFDRAQWFLGSFLGVIMLMGLTAAAWFHTLAGIRHLFWDAGHGYDVPTFYKTGRAVVFGTAVLTALTWLALLISW